MREIDGTGSESSFKIRLSDGTIYTTAMLNENSKSNEPSFGKSIN